MRLHRLRRSRRCRDFPLHCRISPSSWTTRSQRPRFRATIRAAGGALLADVRLFDVYRGGQLPAGKKSMAFSLAFQAGDRTLTDAEVDAEKPRILETVSSAGGAPARLSRVFGGISNRLKVRGSESAQKPLYKGRGLC